jgi:hypothetical protein
MTILIFCIMDASAQQKLPDDIAQAFAKSDRYFAPGTAMSTDDPKFIGYILKNWRWIANEIEILPKLERDIPEKDVAFNVSVIRFSETCEKLSPLEYVDFLDQMLVLYEQKRISDNAFENALSPSLEKRDFLAVNYEHPRVAAILKKKIGLTPPEDEDARSGLEDMANGKFADNYMYDRGDDDPLPETLPGVKLKRPWGSLIQKYERLTGKKVPPAPDFPDEDQTRPERRAGTSGATHVHREDEALANDGSMSPAIWGAAGLACVAAAVTIIRRLRKKKQ